MGAAATGRSGAAPVGACAGPSLGGTRQGPAAPLRVAPSGRTRRYRGSMHGWPAALLLALALLAPAQSPRCEEPAEAGPPPGAAADVALWRRGQQAGEAVVTVRSEAGRLQQRVKSERLAERLEAAASGAAPEVGGPLLALRQRLLGAWSRSYEVASRRWPVDPTRVCWSQLLIFESALRAPASASQSDLRQARTELSECADRAELAVRAQAAPNRELAEASEAAARALATPAAGPAPADVPAGGDR